MGKANAAPARGMRDVLPAEVALRDYAQRVILETYESFGYAHIETPAVERIENLTSGQGGDNEKLIFKILKRGEKLDLAAAQGEADLVDQGLRFDLTVPLARYYAAHHAELPQPFKAIQVGPVWRAERPQKGRYRQFTQCDIDVIGEHGEIAETDLILATVEALAKLGLSDPTVRINDRRMLVAIARSCDVPDESHDSLFITLDKLDKIGMDGVRKELLEQGLGDGPVSRLEELLAQAPSLDGIAPFADGLVGGDDGARSLGAIHEALSSALGADRLVYDPTLVRGMGYYTGPIFEVAVEGLPYSIAGGGRYDGMIGRLLGRDVPACGFSIGFERLIMLLEERGLRPGRAARLIAVLHPGQEDDLSPSLARAAALREQGHRVALVTGRKKRGKQLDELQRHGFDGWATTDGTADVRFFDEADA